MRKLLSLLGQIVLWIVAMFNVNIVHSQSGNVIVHDPVMIRQGDTYYVFHTGKGISVRSSNDRNTWKREEPVFASTPSWVFQIIPAFEGSMWAPDIIYYNELYYLYYSVSVFGKNLSAIGVTTNKTLNPADPEFKWEDRGMVIQSVPGSDPWNAIDPNVIVDDHGTPWMTFGSFWDGIQLVKLKHTMTSIVSDSTKEQYTIATRRKAGERGVENAIEAPFLFRKNDYYYLFVSWDRCCRGLESTYKIAVGRSKDIRGPYLDKQDVSMIHGGGAFVAQGDDAWAAVGHQAVYSIDHFDYLIFHAYDRQDKGKPKLRIKEIRWDADGWPYVD